ncbi:MAG: aminoacyl-tRNA hydrolase [Pseudomonas fluorescens]|nr:MAG: aminoacyl-tRNA hydrolase [Pseudomonas fluorescens]
MKLLVGLGNPGAAYEDTRHNVGFMLVDAVRRRFDMPNMTAKFKGLSCKGKVGGEDVVLLMPQTFMNLSGGSVQAAAAFYKIAPADIVVVHDELDLALGALRWKIGGGDAGHNGLKSITATLGTPNYGRIRFGIDRPAHKAQVSDYVLHAFGADEVPVVEKRLGQMADKMPEILGNPQAELAKLGGVA